jgi:hypothetical protein
MNISEALHRLQNAEYGSRELDILIGECIGWTKRVQFVGADRRDVWISPELEVSRVPRYTTDLQAAYELASKVVPSHVGACRWSSDGALAQIGEGRQPTRAATREIALCIEAITCLP